MEQEVTSVSLAIDVSSTGYPIHGTGKLLVTTGVIDRHATSCVNVSLSGRNSLITSVVLERSHMRVRMWEYLHSTPLNSLSDPGIKTDEKGQSRGFGVVEYERTDEATRAINMYNGSNIGNR